MDELHFSYEALGWIALAIFVGGFIDLPVKKIGCKQRKNGTLYISANVGGCLIPAGIATYEVMWIAAQDPRVLFAVAVCCITAVVACYWAAQVNPERGIAMPLLLPAVVASLLAQMFAPAQVTPTALIAGVIGPLVGADWLHMKDFSTKSARFVSIGGAGSLDGIVLSGVTAVLLS